jgi:hypothetical protein
MTIDFNSNLALGKKEREERVLDCTLIRTKTIGK